MTTTRRVQFLYASVAWLLGVVLVLAVLEAVSLPLVFTLGVFGVVAIAGLLTPRGIRPEWHGNLYWLVVVSGLGLLAVLAWRFLHILSLV